MGNGFAKVTVCFTGIGETHSKNAASAYLVHDPSLDEGLGHSFCYIRPDPTRLSSSKVHSSEDDFSTTFRSISGAAVSANTSTSLSTDPYASVVSAAAFESSTSFASLPLQPIPKLYSDPGNFPGSGSLERGFLSGPIERGFMSGPLDNRIFSGPMEMNGSNRFKRSFSHGFGLRSGSGRRRVIRVLQRVVSKTISRGQSSIVAPIKGFVVKEPNLWVLDKSQCQSQSQRNELTISSEGSLDDEECNVQWAQGKAGEDRVHVVVSEEHGWVFVGIYDGFNGPDAPDFLLSNLYNAVHREVKGLLWDDKVEVGKFVCENAGLGVRNDEGFERDCHGGECPVRGIDPESYPCASGEFGFDSSLRRKRGRGKYRGVAKKWEENQRRWKCEFDRERMELDRRLKEQLNKSGSNGKSINHGDVLKALSQALKKTEESYLDIADKMLMENPELALMGSCVLVMLMKGEDVYVMNVGDSRAVVAQKAEPDYGLGKVRQDLERIKEETLHDLEAFDGERSSNTFPSLTACQLTVDHSTSVEEEVQRIRNEHPDDAGAVMNDRVKGSLKVTRAFGAGFLKQPKWNDALLEMFRIDYVGRSPYINCLPSLHHHRLGPKDRFLILCSDGLYQYLTNEEAVNEVELFIALQPEGDPAQHLVEEVLFRAAKNAGMDFHELLEIPQGDRRRYHDDISIIVISLEGRIWRSCV